jgi:hypothetical protein
MFVIYVIYTFIMPRQNNKKMMGQQGFEPWPLGT